MTEDQEYCTEMLADWVLGSHHLPKVHEFGTGVCINYAGDLSTYDHDRLTRLVLLAHKYSVRIEIGSSGPGMVKVIAHRRIPKEEGQRFWQGHPTLEHLRDSIDSYLNMWSMDIDNLKGR